MSACKKHPYIKTEEVCQRCKTPICLDCRIRETIEPYCSSWCLNLARLDNSLKPYLTIDSKSYTGRLSGRNISVRPIDILLLASLISFPLLYFSITNHLTTNREGKLSEQTSSKNSAFDKEKHSHFKSPSMTIVKPLKNVISPKPSSPVSKEQKELSIHSISRGSTHEKRLSLTFDGGSSDSSAIDILNILLKKGIKTTFFLTGEFIKNYPDTTKRIVQDGHEVGNHTFSHPHLTTFEINRKHITSENISYFSLKNELDETKELFKKVTGKDMLSIWRAPFGEKNKEILMWAARAGYNHVAWTANSRDKVNMDSLDWVSDPESSLYLTANEIKNRLLKNADDEGKTNGSIVLMHLGTNRKEEILHEKLGEIIESFLLKGYEIVPVTKLITEKITG